ncbi:uncharacterized protein GBIM_15690 [Gryllus bimaculatus]|nr:uncharacterized protein GBIM_15690 [Gryllus bimaculatus]
MLAGGPAGTLAAEERERRRRRRRDPPQGAPAPAPDARNTTGGAGRRRRGRARRGGDGGGGGDGRCGTQTSSRATSRAPAGAGPPGVVARPPRGAPGRRGRGDGPPWTVFLALACSESQAPALSRAFNRTLANATKAMGLDGAYGGNVTLAPLLLPFPEGRALHARALERSCAALAAARRVAALLLVGGSPAAVGMALAAGAAGVPVLWARGSALDPPGFVYQILFVRKRTLLEVSF